jgi:predicted amidohydrolase
MPDSSTIRAAAIQMHPQFGDCAGNLRRAEDLIKAHPADLYVLPELFNTGYLFCGRQEVEEYAEAYPDGQTARFLADLSGDTRSVIVGGFAERSREGRIYNAAAIGDRGRLLACYRKIHLFDQEWDWFDSGNRPPAVIASSAGRLGPMICFDWIFPETARCLALAGAQILVHAANLVMPYCQDAMFTRCVENRLFGITANRIGTDSRGGQQLTFTGGSQITGHAGERLAKASTDREEVLVTEIDPGLADDKYINPANHLFRDRRPGFYSRLWS